MSETKKPIRLLNGWLRIRPDAIETKTKGGILLHDDAKPNRFNTGTILDSAEYYYEMRENKPVTDKKYSSEFTAGDRVFYDRYGTLTTSLKDANGEPVQLIQHHWIQGHIDE